MFLKSALFIFAITLTPIMSIVSQENKKEMDVIAEKAMIYGKPIAKNILCDDSIDKTRRRGMQMKRALVTGGNRGLGFEIAKRLIKKGWQVSVTARNVDECRAIYQKESLVVEQLFGVDIFTASTQSLEAVFSKMGRIDVVIHTASPYMRIPFHLCKMEEIDQFTNCMNNDQKIANLAMNYFKRDKKGILIFTGSIVGMPEMDLLGEMSLVKAHLRKLANICDYEVEQLGLKDIYVRHFNLGTFARPAISYFSEVKDYCMDTDEVADHVIAVIFDPDKYPHNINLYRPEEAKKYGIFEESDYWMFDKRDDLNN